MSLSWIVLVLSGTLEAVWATALAQSRGFRRPLPVVVFLISLALAVGGLAYAMIEIPAGTAYAVWVGVGVTVTAAWAMITRNERPTLLKIALLTVLVGSVIGLQLVSGS